MKKITTILFLIVFMHANMYVNEFFKLSKFIEHYTEHRATEHMGIWAFMALHYMSGNVKDDDYKKDMQLPFKDMTNHCHTGVVLDQPIAATTLKPCTSIITKKFGLKNFFMPAYNYKNTIWQPPKHNAYII